MIAGGGPAGMLLGLLLARAGVSVAVLEKHADFLRDFRGDTVHPSTLEVMAELGILEEFLRRPHQELGELRGEIAGRRLRLADFSRLPTRARFIALMPQWDFLDFLAERARAFPSFDLRMRAEVTGLLREGDRVIGVRAQTPEGPLEVRSELTVGADGRTSLVRQQAGLRVQDFGAPIDVLWMRLSRRPGEAEQAAGHIADGRVLVLLNRGSYWQCALVIPKGQFEQLRREPITELWRKLENMVPHLADRVSEIHSWADVRLLTVRVDRLTTWYAKGLLCIGDAAHAMSPIGGVGINLAIQDAVAAANVLAPVLRRGRVSLKDLRQIQRRRELPTRLTQAAQLRIQDRFLAPLLAGTAPASV
ncbi:MAG TPA: FAD-dependent oxidoreductase, partial [Polyangiaceae bacterium]|nr:FAD-dependent oxidoreductase [Polyangiaceae bacterium]